MKPASNPKEITILLVDDREENLLSLEMILEADNRNFIKATSGNEALKVLLKNNDIGLIMLDVQMPDMDGFEVARILKSNPRTRDISIIFVTAINKEEQYVMKGFEEGAVDYLQKPLDINITRAKVNVFEHLFHYQRQLKDSFQQIESINKQLEKFVYTVSHDLKSPLAGISTLISAMEYDIDPGMNADLEKKIGMLKKASAHLTSMVDSILEYSRKSTEQQTKEEVNVGALVAEITQLLFPPDHVRFIISGDLPVIKTKKLKLQQVFQNLISNAIKYNDKAEAVIEIGVKDETAPYCFFVKDNGPGIDEESSSKIFDLFSTGNNIAKGESSTGVGLNLLKMIVGEQGGKIWMENNTSQGAVFYFEWNP